MRILVLDDDDVRHEAFSFFFGRRMIHDDDLEVTQVKSFQGAVDELISKPQFDIVFLDHDLNDFHYRSLNAPAGVVVRKEDKARYELTGFDVAHYIAKVMDKTKLPKLVVVHSWNPPAADGMMEFLYENNIPAKRWLFNSTEDPLTLLGFPMKEAQIIT